MRAHATVRGNLATWVLQLSEILRWECEYLLNNCDFVEDNLVGE